MLVQRFAPSEIRCMHSPATRQVPFQCLTLAAAAILLLCHCYQHTQVYAEDLTMSESVSFTQFVWSYCACYEGGACTFFGRAGLLNCIFPGVVGVRLLAREQWAFQLCTDLSRGLRTRRGACWSAWYLASESGGWQVIYSTQHPKNSDILI